MRARAVAIACLLVVAPLAAEEQVSVEFLEFLGSFETADGKWIDPTQLEPSAPDTPKMPEAPADAEEKTDE